MIISLFIFLGLFVNKKIESNQELISYMLFIFMPILIGMGFYVSIVSSIVIIFSMKYFLNGVFKFFSDYKEDLLDDKDEEMIDLENIDNDIIGLDESQNELPVLDDNDKINEK